MAPEQIQTSSTPTSRLRLVLDCIVEREQLYEQIARILHDDLGQTLLILNLQLYWVSRHCPDERHISDKISEMQEIIGYTSHSVSRLMRECRPLQCPPETPFSETVHILVEQFQCESGIDCRLSMTDRLPALPRDYIVAVARILHRLLATLHAEQQAAGVALDVHGDNDALRINIDQTPCPAGIPIQVRTWIEALGGQCHEPPATGHAGRVAFTLPVISDDD